MILGRVCGSVNSTINHNFYNNRRLLLVDRLDRYGKETGLYLLAVDTIYAGAGETVLVIDEGNSARQVTDDQRAPVRSVVVGVVDDINTNNSV
jgi:ethanolamine utilization protein EutN